MFEFLSYGFGSVFGGLITALIISASLLLISIKYSDGNVRPMALVGAVLLICLLFYQMTSMYCAIYYKGVAMKFITALNLQTGGNIDGKALEETIRGAITENPILFFFIDYADLQDFDWTQPIQSLRNIVSKEFNLYIFHRILWSLLFIVVFGGLMFIPSQRRKRRKRDYSFEDYSEFTDF